MTKTFAPGVDAVRGVDLDIASGEFMVLVGPSGCGKSTLLRMIAGIEHPTAGSIEIAGRDVSQLEARGRDVAMVFQNYALYPHMDVRHNLGYGLRVRKTPAEEIERRVAAVARLIGLTDLLHRKPSALSGGQRQRVAMGRAVIREPAAFLMDEPLSNLDAKLRVSLRSEIARLHDRLGTTTVYVTHDQVEAMTLGQRVAVMRDGQVQQVAPPQQLYRAPANVSVATFIGSPTMNLVGAEVRDGVLRLGTTELPLQGTDAPPIEGRVIVGIRPHDFEPAAVSGEFDPVLDADVVRVEELGSETHITFPLDVPRLDLALDGEAADEAQERGGLLAGEDRAMLTAALSLREPVRPGDRVRLACDPRRLHFFHPVSHENLRAHPMGVRP
ncbi:MAG TPA: ATP-binding cassette domain-containing protein [Solirubrobacteraceae bacterium]